MPITWSMLRSPQPTTLAAARALAHRAVQWPSRAARANLKPAPDDSHSALAWDPDTAALLCLPLKGGIRVGLRVGVHEMVFAKGEHIEPCPLSANTETEVGEWLDSRLEKEGLKPATGATLPYDMPPSALGRPTDEAPRLAALAGWFAAGAEVFDALRGKYKRYQPGPTHCWPHHFDIAMVFDVGGKKGGRTIRVGLSPGDDYYAQPYFYLSPSPTPDTENLPPLPPAGRWHTHEFFGAVATGVQILALEDPRAGLLAVLEAAFEESLKRLGAG